MKSEWETENTKTKKEIHSAVSIHILIFTESRKFSYIIVITCLYLLPLSPSGYQIYIAQYMIYISILGRKIYYIYLYFVNNDHILYIDKENI